MAKFAVATLLFFCTLASPGLAVNIPALTGPVVDDAGLLSVQEKTDLEQRVLTLNAAAKVQLAILIARSLEGTDIADFSIQVADKWKLGKKGTDRGLLLIAAPAEHKLRLEVGYGLEGDITDVVSRRILDNGITPFFRKGEYGVGLAYAVQEIGDKLGVKTAPVGAAIQSADDSDRPEPIQLRTILFLLIFFLWFLFSIMRPRRFGYWGGGGFGGWGGGGFGGGGFGGGGGFSGGGGGFGGGGSSGGW